MITLLNLNCILTKEYNIEDLTDKKFPNISNNYSYMFESNKLKKLK